MHAHYTPTQLKHIDPLASENKQKKLSPVANRDSPVKTTSGLKEAVSIQNWI